MIRKPYSLHQILLILLLLLILPLNIISIAISSIIINDSFASIRNSLEVTLSAYTDSIDHVIYNSEYQLYHLLNNDVNGITYLSSPDSLAYELSKSVVVNTLIETKPLVPQADLVYFYRTDLNDLLIVPHNSTTFDQYLAENDYFTKPTAENGIWHLVSLDGVNYLTKQQFQQSTAYGSFINLDSHINDLADNIHYPVDSITFSQEPLSPPNGKMLVSSQCDNASVFLNVTISNSVLTRNISLLRWILIVLSIFYIILIPILYRFIDIWFIHPLVTLNIAHAQLEQGIENYRINTPANSREFQQAYDSFNNMAHSLQNLKLEKISHELVHKQMLLDNLQLQIRPHFLLNTFNLIYSMMQAKKVKPAQEMLLYLSEYFRFLFKYDHDLVLFAKEWELIKQYLDVSKYQYPDAFTFNSSFDPEVSLVRIPPLLLHSFIENILRHALVNDKVVHIMVSGFYENGIVTFQVADDGCGMPEDEVAYINSSAFEDYPRGRHLGLRNAVKRLKYFYNNTGTVFVESTINEGTVFTITFPFNLEETEDENDEFTDGE